MVGSEGIEPPSDVYETPALQLAHTIELRAQYEVILILVEEVRIQVDQAIRGKVETFVSS